MIPALPDGREGARLAAGERLVIAPPNPGRRAPGPLWGAADRARRPDG
jgi:hypothetical protein